MKFLAHCNPQCMNGGKCVSGNKCECPKNFSGAQCQTVTEACSLKSFGFNGSFNCSGVGDMMSCNIGCPEGVSFDIKPAPIYQCNVTKGTFSPSPIPKCVYGEGVEVIQMPQVQQTPGQFAGNRRRCFERSFK